jgi:hypothetical protein
MDAAAREKIQIMVDRLKGPGGVPLTEKRKSRLRTWLHTLSKKGYLGAEVYKHSTGVEEVLSASFPNAGSRAQFISTILLYFSALTDEEFQADFPCLLRGEVVATLREVASKANRQYAATRSK